MQQEPSLKNEEEKKHPLYTFWLGIVSAVALAVVQVLSWFGIALSGDYVTTAVSAVLGALAVGGILTKPQKEKDEEKEDEKDQGK